MKIMSKCATSKIEFVLVLEESFQSADIKPMTSFRVLPTIKRMVNVLPLVQMTKMMDQKIVVVPSEYINFALSVSVSK